ncbi:hypothetical protein [Streptomyces sp. NPDC047453]|uniref:hypothetical protein n=1 Tax=Streptomyces sp. NPDC047453 TaxID=3154812 RepID=UPI0033DC6384
MPSSLRVLGATAAGPVDNAETRPQEDTGGDGEGKPGLAHAVAPELVHNYDQVIKYATAIRTGSASTEAILSRFTRAATYEPDGPFHLCTDDVLVIFDTDVAERAGLRA